MVFVADLTNGGAAAGVDVTDFAGRHTQLGVSAILGDELNGSTSGASNLGATQRAELNRVNHGTGRDVLQRQVVARLDISLSTSLDDVALLNTLRRDDVALLSQAISAVWAIRFLSGHQNTNIPHKSVLKLEKGI